MQVHVRLCVINVVIVRVDCRLQGTSLVIMSVLFSNDGKECESYPGIVDPMIMHNKAHVDLNQSTALVA